MATVWPQVVAWLLRTAPDLPGWSGVVVIDGPPVMSVLPDDYLTVGFAEGANDGTLTITPNDDGFTVIETGDVRCTLAAVTETQMDLAARRERVFAMFDALADAVKADRRLGGTLSPQGFATLTVDPQGIANATGTAMSLVFSLTYTSIS